MTGAMPLKAAAVELGIRLGAMRRLVRDGAPVVRKGHRGRACSTLVDIDAIREWQRGGADAIVREVASALPLILAETMQDTFQQAVGHMSNAQAAALLSAAWLRSANAVNDYMQTHCAGIPNISAMPAEIDRLRKIAQNIRF